MVEFKVLLLPAGIANQYRNATVIIILSPLKYAQGDRKLIKRKSSFYAHVYISKFNEKLALFFPRKDLYFFMYKTFVYKITVHFKFSHVRDATNRSKK